MFITGNYIQEQYYMYPSGRKFSLRFKFRDFANGIFAKLKFAYYFIFWNLSMIAYIIEIQKSKFSNIKLNSDDSVNLTNLSQVAKLNSVFIFTLSGIYSLIIS